MARNDLFLRIGRRNLVAPGYTPTSPSASHARRQEKGSSPRYVGPRRGGFLLSAECRIVDPCPCIPPRSRFPRWLPPMSDKDCSGLSLALFLFSHFCVFQHFDCNAIFCFIISFLPSSCIANDIATRDSAICFCRHNSAK